LLGQCFLQVARFGAQRLHFAAVGLTGRIPSQALLAPFQEVLRPTLIEAFRDAFPVAQRGDAVLAAPPLKDDANFLLHRILLAGLAPDVANESPAHPIYRVSHTRRGQTIACSLAESKQGTLGTQAGFQTRTMRRKKESILQ
jgi:hypothetical protein